MTDQPPSSEHTGEQVSVVDLFTISIGPSSLHTVGPMGAAAASRRL